jgi:hypothetical protein
VGRADDDRLALLLLGEVVDHAGRGAAAEGPGLDLEQRLRAWAFLLFEDLVGLGSPAADAAERPGGESTSDRVAFPGWAAAPAAGNYPA